MSIHPVVHSCTFSRQTHTVNLTEAQEGELQQTPPQDWPDKYLNIRLRPVTYASNVGPAH